MAEAKKRLGLTQKQEVAEVKEVEEPKERQEEIPATNFASLTKSQLYSYMKEHNIPRPEDQTKDSLVKAVEDFYNGGNTQQEGLL